jgi:cysteine-rich repeat protein
MRKITAALGLLLVLQGCRQADSVVLLNVEAGANIPQVAALRVTMSTAQSHDTKVFSAQPSTNPVAFPTSLALVIPRSRSGRLDLVVEGLDATAQATVASGTAQTIIAVGGQVQTSILLLAGPMLCGNGVIDPGEQCDDGNLFSFDSCDFRCMAQGLQFDAGAVDSLTVETGIGDGAADGATDALVDRTLIETGSEVGFPADALVDRPLIETGGNSVDSPMDVALPPVDGTIPDVPYVADVALDFVETGAGGATGTGGMTGAGGAAGAGGAVGAGGTIGAGGATNQGGATATGGNPNTGGIANTGGSAGAGGSASTGGAAITGGTMSTGGNAGTGGASGGASGTGGSAGTLAGTPGQSCTGLPATCGPYGNESCCASLLVPGGTFYRSYDGVDFTDQGFPATVSSFALDRYEVTVGRFRAFVQAGQGTKASPPAAGAGAHPLIVASGWDAAWTANLLADTASLKSAIKCDPGNATWTDTPGASENRPMNCLIWYEAFAFCAWDGGRLPTDAEWNYAAAGGSEQRYYPWSNPPTSTTINATYAVYSISGTNAKDVGSKSPKGDGKWGHADLGGNEWEVVLDYFNSPYSRNICTNCADLSPTDSRVIHGGGFLDIPRVADRGSADPMYRNYDVGLRCARTSQ